MPSAGHQLTGASATYATVVVDVLAALTFVELRPRTAVVGLARPGFELRDQLLDRARLVGFAVVPGVEDLEEDPLGPAVVGDIGGGDPPARIVAQPEGAQLAAVVRDVVLGRDPRVLAGLDRVLLGRQTERVEAHRVQDVEAGHAREAGVDVGSDEAERVADVEALAAGIREHVEHVALGKGRALGVHLAQQADGIRRVEGALLVPPGVPLRLDRVRQRRVVPVGRNVGGRLGGTVGHDSEATEAGRGAAGLFRLPPQRH